MCAGYHHERRAGGGAVDAPFATLVRRSVVAAGSGAGWLGYVDTQGTFERVTFCGGYPRGLAIVDHYALVGLSLSRHEPTFQGLPLEQELAQRGAVPRCGLLVVDLQSGDVAHWVRIEGKVHELYDVVALPGVRRAEDPGLHDGRDSAQRLVPGAGSGQPLDRGTRHVAVTTR